MFAVRGASRIQSSRANRVSCRLKLKIFQKFPSAATAVEEATAIGEGKVTSTLSSLLDSIKDEKKASLAVADPKLGKVNVPSYVHQRLQGNSICYQQIATTVYRTHLRLLHGRAFSGHQKPPSIADSRSFAA